MVRLKKINKDTDIELRLPTRSEAVLFRLKTAVFQTRHSVVRQRLPAFTKSDITGAKVIAESRSDLYSSDDAREWALQSGKVQNLRVAASFLDGIVVPAGETFSFWAQVPRPTRRRGFVDGRELREGCIVPSVGGGLCQLSNGLYDCALKAGLEIVERHGHSRKIPDSFAEAGRDATIFWNYVDLKFRADCDWQVRVFLTHNELIVQIVAEALPGRPGELVETTEVNREAARSCETCGMVDCFQHPTKQSLSPENITVWAVDSYSPEFGEYLKTNREPSGWLLTPLSSKRKFGAGRYLWSGGGFERVVDFPAFVVHRSIVSRKLANQGAERQLANLRFNRVLAEKMIRRLPHEADRLVIGLEMLVHFQKSGALGGRTFEVMMTRWPIRFLQEKLDRASQRWPECKTLRDFRVDEEFLELEWDTLQQADSWITAHPEISKIAPEGRVQKLDWKTPPARDSALRGKHLIFPAATAGRNGAYELREAIRELDLPLKLLGPNVEHPDFWKGLDVSPADPGAWLEDAAAVVLPAWILNRPTRLLAAIQRGIPVVTTVEAGVSDLPGVDSVPTGEIRALAEAISKCLD